MMEADGRKPDLDVRSGGHLFLARSEAQARILRENHALQRDCGADGVLRQRGGLAQAFPHLRVADVALAS